MAWLPSLRGAPSPEVKDIPRLARPSCRDQNTQEVPRKVDRQDHGQRQQANHCHEQDDVALKGQVGNGVNAALATDLFIPAETETGNFWNVGVTYQRQDATIFYI